MDRPIFFKTIILKGRDGTSIGSLEKTDTVGAVDTYTVTLTDGETYTFEVTNGTSIANISYTSSSGNVDTYTITLTDGSTQTFQVTNGEDFTVPTDGVIYYAGADVPDGYEETNPPSGSGQYAVIDDANASLQTTYSSTKINELISGVGGGGVDYSTTEQDTGLKWIDGKPIYQKSYHITESTEKAEGEYDISNDNADMVISCYGVVKAGTWGSNKWYTVPRVGDNFYFASISAASTAITIVAKQYNFTEAYATLRYTKTTDTV